MVEKQVRMWVAPEFKKKLKKEALEFGKPLLQYTKELATEDFDKFKADFEKKNKEKRSRFYESFKL